MTRYLLAAVLAVFAVPSFAQAPRCAVGEPSMCHPSLPGLEDKLPPEIATVKIDSFTMRFQGGRWWVDLTLATANHPGEVRIAAWGHDFASMRTDWLAIAGSTTSLSIPVGGANTDERGISVEWDESGTVWHRWIGLHYAGPGTYHFTAGEGSLFPPWL